MPGTTQKSGATGRRWYVESPSEAAAMAALLRRTERRFECRTSGGSMGETLPPGSSIRVRCTQCLPGLGEVAVVLSGRNELVAHRVVHPAHQASAGCVITRGDRLLLCDPPVPASAVLGLVEAFQAGGVWRPVPPAPDEPKRGRRVIRTLHLVAMRGALLLGFPFAAHFAEVSARVLQKGFAIRRRL